MTAEAYVDPLSGEEIQDAVCDQVKWLMRRKCHLNPALAYLAFEAEVIVRLKLKDNGRVETVDVQARKWGGRIDLLSKDMYVEAQSFLGERPPNVVRREAGLAVPTVVEDAQGRRETKPIKYARKAEPEEPPWEEEKKEKPEEVPQEHPEAPSPGPAPGKVKR